MTAPGPAENMPANIPADTATSDNPSRAAELKAAYAAGQAAYTAGQSPTANPYAPARVHPLDPPPNPGTAMLAAVWLRGWQSHTTTEGQQPS